MEIFKEYLWAFVVGGLLCAIAQVLLDKTLSDILIAAVNEAIKRVDDTNTAEMSKITGALGMPGMPGLF